MGWQNDTKDQKSKQQSNVAKMQNMLDVMKKNMHLSDLAWNKIEKNLSQFNPDCFTTNILICEQITNVSIF